MVLTLNKNIIGVVCKDRLDFKRWVERQSYNEDRRYIPIINVKDAESKFDEIVVTTTASANPEYVDIYIKLNGAYSKAKKEYKHTG